MRLKGYAMSLLAAATLIGCSKYDDSAIKAEIDDLSQRVDDLEALCSTINSDVTSLKSIVSAIQAQDYVTAVSPALDADGNEVGYAITFAKADPITIYHGKDSSTEGGSSDEVDAPEIGVQDVNGTLCWTVDGELLKNAEGNNIPTTGVAPKVGVKAEGSSVYWTVNGEYLLDEAGKKVIAAGSNGSNGDSFFDNVTIDEDANEIIFVLDGGTYTVALAEDAPVLTSTLTVVGIEAGKPVLFEDAATAHTFEIKLGGAITKDNFMAIKAEVTNDQGTSTDVATRAAFLPWGVEVSSVKFEDVIGTAEIKVTSPGSLQGSDTGILTITAVDKASNEYKFNCLVSATGEALTVKVTNPGDLAANLYDIDKEYKEVLDNITVIGKLGTADMNTLQSIENLKVLNLENATLPNDKILASHFSGMSKLTKVTLPQSLTTVEYNAFNGCNKLATLVIPNDSELTWIGTGAFKGTLITAVENLPVSVNSLSATPLANAFTATSITKVTFADNSGKIFNTKVLSGLTKINSVAIPEGVETINGDDRSNLSTIASVTLPSTLTEIGSYAFYGTSIASIVLPEGLETIGIEAFSGVEDLVLTTLPASIEFVGPDAFKGTAITEFTIPLNGLATEEAQISTYAAALPVTLETLTYDDAYTTVGAASDFANFRAVTKVNLPKGLLVDNMTTAIFASTLVTEVVAPAIDADDVKTFLSMYKGENLTKIDLSAVTGMDEFRGSMLPVSATSMDALEVVTLPATVTTIAGNAFKGMNALTTVIGMDNVTEIGASAFEGCAELVMSNLTDLTLESIGNRAFNGCTELGISALPTCDNIGFDAFVGVDIKVDTITVPAAGEDVDTTVPAEVSEYVIDYMDNLTSNIDKDEITVINLSAVVGLTEIPKDFAYTTSPAAAPKYANLVEVKLPASVKTIGENAFARAAKLTKINLENVTTIITNAFWGCEALVVNINNTDTKELTSVGIGAFTNTKLSTTIQVPAAVVAAVVDADATADAADKSDAVKDFVAKVAGYGMQTLDLTESRLESITDNVEIATAAKATVKEVKLPASLKSIGEHTFKNLAALTKINLGAVEEIGNYAFYNSPALESIKLDAVKTIGAKAFIGTQIATVKLPAALGAPTYAADGTTIDKTAAANVKDLLDDSFNTAAIVELDLSETAMTSVPLGFTNEGTGSWATTYGELTTVKLPAANTVTTIDVGAFGNATKLETITGLGNVTSVGDNAFYGTKVKPTLTMFPLLTSGPVNFFDGVTEVKAPAGLKTETELAAYMKMFDSADVTSINLSDTKITKLTETTGLGMSGTTKTKLTSLTLPTSCTTLEKSSLSGYSALKTLNATGLKVFGEECLSGCKVLTAINLEKATSLGKNFLKDNEKIITVTMLNNPADVSKLKLEEGAFTGSKFESTATTITLKDLAAVSAFSAKYINAADSKQYGLDNSKLKFETDEQ